MAASLMQHAFSLSPCLPSLLPYPKLFGAEILKIEAYPVSSYSKSIPDQFYFGHKAANVTNLDFCNITVTHTHPGQNDKIRTQLWLPSKAQWNGRMQAIGGGGWSAGMSSSTEFSMAGGANQGWAMLTTDGGHDPEMMTSEKWALLSPGNVDLYALQNLASVSLSDSAAIGKDIITSFYGRRPSYSYWNGCSQGGRQGMMLAQRYPTAYNGIHASAPAIYWNQLTVGDYWPQVVMQEHDIVPSICELDYLTNTAIAECDKSDGVEDGIIALPETCHFDARTAVGDEIKCGNHSIKVTLAAAAAANAAWRGPSTRDDEALWYGLSHDATLTGIVGLVNTNCTGTKTQNCKGVPFSISEEWIRLFVKKNPKFATSELTYEQYENIFLASIREYQSIIGTDEPDLGEFRDAGGKLIAFHGLADTLITPRATEHYHNAVRNLYPDINYFYRLFESPGLAHCGNGVGAYPYGIFERLVDWVENGTAPETLIAEIKPVDGSGRVRKRKLCLYPRWAKYDGQGDPDDANSYTCI